jgi:hypothetical protein
MSIWRYRLMTWLGGLLRQIGQWLLDAAEFDMPPREFDRLMEAGTPVEFPPGRPRPVVRYDWAEDDSLSAEEIRARLAALPMAPTRGPLGGFYRCDHLTISGVTRPPTCYHGCAMEWTAGNLTYR